MLTSFHIGQPGLLTTTTIKLAAYFPRFNKWRFWPPQRRRLGFCCFGLLLDIFWTSQLSSRTNTTKRWQSSHIHTELIVTNKNISRAPLTSAKTRESAFKTCAFHFATIIWQYVVTSPPFQMPHSDLYHESAVHIAVAETKMVRPRLKEKRWGVPELLEEYQQKGKNLPTVDGWNPAPVDR